jgi:hypothetical protein
MTLSLPVRSPRARVSTLGRRVLLKTRCEFFKRVIPPGGPFPFGPLRRLLTRSRLCRAYPSALSRRAFRLFGRCLSFPGPGGSGTSMLLDQAAAPNLPPATVSSSSWRLVRPGACTKRQASGFAGGFWSETMMRR